MSSTTTASLLTPRDLDELSRELARAHQERRHVGTPDLRHLRRILAHVPEDMTVTVEAGITLTALQKALAEHDQWVPTDPPYPENLSIGELLANDCSGPRRYGYGGIRDHVIGMRVALAEGQVIKSGGQVVKNVAGFDLLKLFIGDRGSLGVIVEATFKLLPRPRRTAVYDFECPNLETAERCLESLQKSPLTPVSIDLYRLVPASAAILRVGLEGVDEDVAWQEEQIRSLGFAPASPEDLESKFWSMCPPRSATARSVLPSRLIAHLADRGHQPFLARAGNGIFYSRDSRPTARVPSELERRLKETFDRHHILPALPE